MNELKPCPHCGSADISNATTSIAYCIRCLGCRAEMRSFVSIDDAREKWNKRCSQVWCDCGDSLVQGDAICGTCHDLEIDDANEKANRRV